MLRFLIAENIPSLNKGELAILEGLNESLKIFNEYDLTIFSVNPEMDSKRYLSTIQIFDVKTSFPFFNHINNSKMAKITSVLIFTLKHLIFLFLYFLFKENALSIMKTDIWKIYLKSDVIFVGHNGVFGLGSGLIPGSSLITFMSYLYLPFFRLILKKPLVIYGGSVNSYKKNNIWIRTWMRFVLSKIDLITVRDCLSYKNLQKMGLTNSNAYLTADLAFLLKPATDQHIERILNIENTGKTKRSMIGVTVTREMGYKFSLNLDKNQSYIEHNKLFSQVIDYLIETYNSQIVFIPHSIGFGEELDDRIISRDIFMGCKNKDHIKLITNEYSPSELKGLIGKLDFFIGERLHSVIGALSMAVPSIVITYERDRRIDIVKMLGHDNFILTVEELELNELKSKIDELFYKKDEIISNLNHNRKIVEKKSMMNGSILKNLLDGSL